MSLLYIAPLVVLFISTLTRSALGFADALIAMPLLVMALGIKIAAPLVALSATGTSLIILLRNYRVVDLRATWRIIVSSLAGIPCGLWLLKDVPEQHMQWLLGVLLILFSVYNLAATPLTLQHDRFGLAYLFGFLAGVLGGAYNTVGPLIVVYGHLRRWSPSQFRATLQSCFFPAYAFIVLGHSVTGLLTAKIVTLYLLALPGICVAIFLGGRLNAAIAPGRFTGYVNIALICIGSMLCWQAWS